jgi:phosphatidate phosphatase APP1
MKQNTGNPELSIKPLSLIIKHKLGLLSSPKIVPFIGYGNKNNTYTEGEVVEENGLSRPKEGQSKWRNIKSMIKRYVSNEIEGIKVEITYRGMKQVVTTDKYGIYRCHFNHPSELIPDDIWQKVSVRFFEPGLHSLEKEVVEGEIMMIKDTPEFGVISDIDDTIIVSYATQKLMKLRLMLLNNAHTRMPFEGVSDFYQALQRGSTGKAFNPVFYVSNSEWNLYDLLHDFIQFNRIPKGPLFLRELAIRVLRPWKMKEVNEQHKKEAITKLFSLYNEMKFILIGDSGQKDPELYWNIAKQFPARILAIYIRDAGVIKNVERVEIISRQVQLDFKTDMLLVKDTDAAAVHALEKGFISDLHSFLGEKQKE